MSVPASPTFTRLKASSFFTAIRMSTPDERRARAGDGAVQAGGDGFGGAAYCESVRTAQRELTNLGIAAVTRR